MYKYVKDSVLERSQMVVTSIQTDKRWYTPFIGKSDLMTVYFELKRYLVEIFTECVQYCIFIKFLGRSLPTEMAICRNKLFAITVNITV